MARISGFGGFFFRSRNPEALARWYEDHLGIGSIASGEHWHQEAGPTVFAPFPADTDYFGPSDQAFMLNFRVDDLDTLIEHLRGTGTRIDPKRMDDPAGRFAWVYDPEGNKIELWEPSESSSTET
jgi:glyoxylase I family protein